MQRSWLLSFLLVTTNVAAQGTSGTAASTGPDAKAPPANVSDAVVGHCIQRRYDNFIFANGAIATSLAGEEGSTPATGSLAFRHLAGHDTVVARKKDGVLERNRGGEEFRALLALTNLVDSLRGDRIKTFSRTLLLPAAVGKEGSGEFMYRRFSCKDVTNQEFGLKVSLEFAKTTWAFDSTQADGTHLQLSDDLTAAAFGVFYDMVLINQFDNAGNILAFTTDVGATIRGFAGDAAANSDLRSHALGTNRRWFGGPALSMGLRFRNVVGKADLTYLFGGRSGVPGLTGVQTVVGFNLEAPVFSFATGPGAKPPE
jgi:hypothetical protein